MSHYSVLIIGKNIENKLAPFDESLEVSPYVDVKATEVKKSIKK